MARVWAGPADDVDEVLLMELETELLDDEVACKDVLDREVLELTVDDTVGLEETELLLTNGLATGLVPFLM